MKSRLQYIIDSEGLTNIKFAELIGVNPASVSHILAERNKPSFDFVAKIAEKLPKYNLRWLLTGTGSPIETSEQSQYSSEQNVAASIDYLPEVQALERSLQENEVVEQPTIDSSNTNNQPKAPTEFCYGSHKDKLIICFPDGTFDEFIRR